MPKLYIEAQDLKPGYVVSFEGENKKVVGVHEHAYHPSLVVVVWDNGTAAGFQRSRSFQYVCSEGVSASEKLPERVFVRLQGYTVVGAFINATHAEECPEGTRTVSVPLYTEPVHPAARHTYVWWMKEPEPVYCGITKDVAGSDEDLAPIVNWTKAPNDEFLVVSGIDKTEVQAALYASRDEWLEKNLP